MQAPSDFFNALYGTLPDEYIAELRFIPEGGGTPTRLYRPANQMQHGNFEALDAVNQHSHIYHRVNLSLEKRSRKVDIVLAPAIWLDIDEKSPEIYTKLEEHHYPPTMLIDSGRGWHAYWLLKEPVALTNDRERAEYERTIEGLILDFGDVNADKHVKDCTRILRTPFFRNIKAKYAPDYPTCKVVWYDDSMGDRYKFDWLYKRYSPLGAAPMPIIRRELPVINDGTKPKWILDYLASGVGEGSRNKRLYDVARWFHDIGDNSSGTEQDLISRALADGLSQSEAATTIKSAWSAPRNASTAIDYTMKKRYALGDKSIAGKKKK
jgi:hypothetical protein